MDLNNNKTLRELVINKIKEIFTTKWELKDFIQTGVWKPDKKNITMNSFAERMRIEEKEIPSPGERFEYVEMCYNNSGCIQRLDNLSPFEYEKLVIPS